MSRCTFAGLFVLSAGLVFGQLDSNTVTVTASRTSNPEPDQALFAVSVQSSLTASLGNVLAALQGSGLTFANFSGVGTAQQNDPQGQPMVEWTFGLTAPLTGTKDTVAALTRLQQNIAQSKNGLALSFRIQGTLVSQQPQSCVAADLIADARAQAQKTAASAGLAASSIVSISGSTSACSVTVTFGQATSKSVTIAASQQLNVTQDQIIFFVTVTSSLSTGLDDVIAALQGSGITAANFSGVYTQTTYTSQNQQQQYLQWTFTLPVFFGSMQDTVASLTNLQKAIAQQKNGLTLSFGPEGTRVSPQAQQAHQCSTTSLIADAQAQAQRLADAAGLVLGPVLAISEASSSPPAILAGAAYLGAIQTNSGALLWNGVVFPIIPPPAFNCSLAAKFALFGG